MILVHFLKRENESVYGDFGLQLVNKKRLIKSLLKDEHGISLIT